MKIALLGTRGVPVCYGGFETCVEEVGSRLASNGHEVVVYCRGTDATSPEYRGMQLVHLPMLRRKTLETLSHTTLSVLHLRRNIPDVAIVFNAANAPLIPFIPAPTALHVDGLESRRAKWGSFGRRYYLAAEWLGVRLATELIADAIGIQNYYAAKYRARSRFIPYGAPIVDVPPFERLREFGLTSDGYLLVVARLEPENNVHMIIDGYVQSGSALPMVVVGSAPYGAEYVAELMRRSHGRVRFVGGVWDQELLDALYAGARAYFHGHSVGGTNPSLLRAMGAGATVLAFDVEFSREVLGDCGYYFSNADQAGQLALLAERSSKAVERSGLLAQERVATKYVWDDVAEQYEALCHDLLNQRVRGWRRFGPR
jgi:glycosyltransferase involved in cell wall biosynthesis